jgi:hypothetical protein
MMRFMRAEFDALRREMRSERDIAVSFLNTQLNDSDPDPSLVAPGVNDVGLASPAARTPSS